MLAARRKWGLSVAVLTAAVTLTGASLALAEESPVPDVPTSDVAAVDEGTEVAEQDAVEPEAVVSADGVEPGLDQMFAQGEVAAIGIQLPAATPTPIAAPDMSAYVVAPTCDAPGTLSFLTNTPAQNPNGYEFEGQGFRVYLSPAYAGPGTYTATIQKVGPGFDPAFPDGTKITSGSTSQTLVVGERLAAQSTDPSGACYVAPVDSAKPEVVVSSGECVSGAIIVSATDDLGLAKIVGNIYNSAGVLVKSTQAAITGTSGSLTVDPMALPLGKYSLRYNALDASGKMSATKTFAFKTDCERPAVTVDVSGAKCGGSVTFDVADNGTLDYAVLNLYKADGTFVKTIARKDGVAGPSVSLSAALVDLPDGEYFVKAGAFDIAGNNGTVSSAHFIVSCVSPLVAPTEVTPIVPTWSDPCGPGNGAWSFADSAEYTYSVTSYSNGKVKIVVSPAEGYAFPEGTAVQWQRLQDDAPCTVELTVATPADSAAVQSTCSADIPSEPLDGSVDIAIVEGVDFMVDGDVVSGVLPVLASEMPKTVVITARAQDGYVLPDSDWSQTIDLVTATGCKGTDALPTPLASETGSPTPSQVGGVSSDPVVSNAAVVAAPSATTAGQVLADTGSDFAVSSAVFSVLLMMIGLGGILVARRLRTAR